MSKQIEAMITCSDCAQQFRVKLYRTLWIEDSKNRELVLTDKANSVTCPFCKFTSRLEFPFLCTNVKKGIAIWYEPYHDPAIDKDVAQYAEHFGATSFYALAPRIRNWGEFKKELQKMEASVLAGPTSRASISPEINMVMSRSIDPLGTRPSGNYPAWLRSLRLVKKWFSSKNS